MLNLFQHPTGQLIITQNTLRVGSRNKFGMTRILDYLISEPKYQ
jgi:hypothetical protein